MPQQERRDTNLDSNGSSAQPKFQGLGQNGAQQSHPGPPPSHSPLFAVPTGHTSPAMKRKQIDNSMNTHVMKRRRDADDVDAFDVDGSGQGAKHWTDEEKSKLFSWLMGPGQDEHWNSLRATKNSCLRECALEVFEGKKSYQALKGCYERNFNLFKQIYAYEIYHAHAPGLSSYNEADRLREYERRLQSARKAGCDVGNVTARTVDHWHRVGWYDLFYRRWHGDPATTRPIQPRISNGGPGPSHTGGDDLDLDDDPPQINFPDPPIMSNGINTPVTHDRPHTTTQNPVNYINPQTLREPVVSHSSSSPVITNSSAQQNGANTTTNHVPPAPASSATSSSQDSPAINLTITQGMLSTCLQYLQVQTQTGKMKLEYMKRREEREEKESAHRRDLERMRLERETAEYEHKKKKIREEEMTTRALSMLENPNIDDGLRKAAGDYLKKLFEAK
ncbi:hypothetical protein H0H92_015549 [Tricholoma furcatifolium]|nr:hypothetical protein H0H92_015549 [Tricholoma furcatifolium]